MSRPKARTHPPPGRPSDRSATPRALRAQLVSLRSALAILRPSILANDRQAASSGLCAQPADLALAMLGKVVVLGAQAEGGRAFVLSTDRENLLDWSLACG